MPGYTPPTKCAGCAVHYRLHHLLPPKIGCPANLLALFPDSLPGHLSANRGQTEAPGWTLGIGVQGLRPRPRCTELPYKRRFSSVSRGTAKVGPRARNFQGHVRAFFPLWPWGRRHSEPGGRTFLCAPMWPCVRPSTCPQERFFGGCISGGSPSRQFPLATVPRRDSGAPGTGSCAAVRAPHPFGGVRI